MNKMKEVKKLLGENINEGRPNKANLVEMWQQSHPQGKKADCIRDTGLSKPTVYKWWKEPVVGEGVSSGASENRTAFSAGLFCEEDIF